MVENFWEQYDKAFKNSRVSAYALINDGKPMGTVTMKHPADGMGRLTTFIWIAPNNGNECVLTKVSASGWGYDKATATVQEALVGTPYEIARDGKDWKDALRDMGITVFSTIRL